MMLDKIDVIKLNQ